MRVALVGLGRMGEVHTEALKTIGLEVSMGFDVDRGVADAYSRDYGIPTYDVSELPKLLGYRPVDGIILATTAPSRFQTLSFLLQDLQIKWVLSEKPFVSSLYQLSTALELFAKANVRLGINHQAMFKQSYKKIYEVIASEELGSLHSVNVSGANIGLANNVSHIFEAFRYLTGSEIVLVRGFLDAGLRACHRGPSFKDYSGSLLGENVEGVKLFVDFSSGIGHGISSTYNFSWGKVVIDELVGHVRITKRLPQDRSLSDSKYSLQSLVENMQLEPEDLVSLTAEVIRGVAFGEPSFPGAAAAAHSFRSIVATVISSENGSRSQSTSFQSMRPFFERTFPWS
jgi:predicted dehydrogenase